MTRTTSAGRTNRTPDRLLGRVRSPNRRPFAGGAGAAGAGAGRGWVLISGQVRRRRPMQAPPSAPGLELAFDLVLEVRQDRLDVSRLLDDVLEGGGPGVAPI